MEEKSFWETIKVEGTNLLERLRMTLREGNVRKVVVKQGDRSIAEFPLTVGVVGTVFAPILAAVGALVALLNDCSIEVERNRPAETQKEPEPPSAETAETPEQNNEEKMEPPIHS